MTYVTDQTPQQLRAHMRMLQKTPGWHNPLDDRLFKEILDQDTEIETLRSHNALLRGSIAQIERESDRLRQALDGLLNAMPSATTHPAIQAARAALSQEPT